jgi:hypothetical protein
MANGGLMANSATFNPSIGHQQDPHECMTFLLENMHHELCLEDDLVSSSLSTPRRCFIGGSSIFTELFAIEYIVHNAACGCLTSTASTEFRQEWMLGLSLQECACDLKNVLKKFFSDEDLLCKQCGQV